MFSSELPTACRMLYETVLSCELDLEFDMGIMDVRFSDAIRYNMINSSQCYTIW